MKKLLILTITLTAKLVFGQVEASNLPPVSMTTNDDVLITQLSGNGRAALSTVPTLASILAPWISFNQLSGTLPATATLTNGASVAWNIIATNITANAWGVTQTNYLIQPYITNGVNIQLTNMSSVTSSNRLGFTNGILTHVF